MVSPPATCHRHDADADAETLGLEPDEADPVRIILAAQLRLRSCRRGQVAGSRCTPTEVRRIIAARDALLRRAVGSMTRFGTTCITSGRMPATAGPPAATAAGNAGRQ